MFRFFVTEKIANHFILDQQTLNHIKVARINEKMFICIYKKKFYECILDSNKALIKQLIDENHEFNGEVILGVALIKIKRFEWMIQKAAELGATKLIPIITQNVNISHHNLQQRMTRWQTISKNACEQAFRNQIMEVMPISGFDEILTVNMPHKFIAHEQETSPVNLTFSPNSLFLIGPEGGFTIQEINRAQTFNFKPISLGSRILRSETSALFVLSRIND